MDFIKWLFAEDGFMPHGHCYLWNPGLLNLHIISDGIIALAYFSIPFTLVYFVRRRRDLEFHWMFLCFAVFIVACGTTHVMEIWTIWHPAYWLAGGVKAVTAVASLLTGVLLVKIMPQALALPSPTAMIRINDALEREIAERKNSEAKVLQLNAELLERADQLEIANKELDAFSYTISHDLRAPLRHISGYVELVSRKAGMTLDPENRGHLETITNSVVEMEQLINALLEFSRIGRISIGQATVDTNQLVEKSLAGLETETRHRHIVWKKDPLPAVIGDASLLRQVFTNLLSNAIKYSRPRNPAEITIGCARRDRDEVVLFVRDNGVGFDMKYVDKLFGVFQRLHHATEFEGTGIGLANVRRIITRHGGRIWVEATPGQGATFYFTLKPSTEGLAHG